MILHFELFLRVLTFLKNYFKNGISIYCYLGKDASDAEIYNAGRRVSLSGGKYEQSSQYTAANGLTVTSTCAAYSCYYLARLFDRTYSAGSCDFFYAQCSSATLTTDLGKSTFVNHIRLYPYCSSASDFKVK